MSLQGFAQHQWAPHTDTTDNTHTHTHTHTRGAMCVCVSAHWVFSMSKRLSGQEAKRSISDCWLEIQRLLGYCGVHSVQHARGTIRVCHQQAPQTLDLQPTIAYTSFQSL